MGYPILNGAGGGDAPLAPTMEPHNNLVQEYVKKHFTLSTRSYPGKTTCSYTHTRLSAEGLAISKTFKFYIDKRKR